MLSLTARCNRCLHPRYRLRRFHRPVSEQELDLLKFSTGHVAQASAGAAHIMRSQIRDARGCAVSPHHTPDYFLRYTITPDCAGIADTPEEPSVRDLCSGLGK